MRSLEVIEDTGVLFETDYPPLLTDAEGRTEFTVHAICVDLRIVHLPQFKRESYILTFRIVEPYEFEGVILECHAPKRKWEGKKIPISAKIVKMAIVASAGQRKGKITKRMFVGKMFECRVRVANSDPMYSVIDSLTAVVAG